ncbi:MAG TPA: glycerol-3-phosphate acyltransferase, partial [Mobilitalea sp.]|nr:glycerol-3-phosphate acyltransferase [Mobilitalea sp.]
MILQILICLAFGYLFGCFSTGYFVGKLNKVDIRKYGSGNTGTTNALRTMGTKAGALVLLGDMLKAVIQI